MSRSDDITDPFLSLLLIRWSGQNLKIGHFHLDYPIDFNLQEL